MRKKNKSNTGTNVSQTITAGENVKKISAKTVVINVLLILILSGLIAWSYSLNINSTPLNRTSDANQYIRVAYHMLHDNMASQTLKGEPIPTSRREPVFPFYLSTMIRIDSKLKGMAKIDIREPGKGLERLRYYQIPVVIAMAVLAWVLTKMLTGRTFLSYIAMAMAGFSHSLFIIAHSLKREHFMAMMLLIVAVFIFKTITTGKKRYFTFLGLSLAGLVLTNAIFMHFVIVLIAFLLFLLKKGMIEKKQLFVGLAIMLVCYLVPTGAWMTRNYRHFGRFYICDRASDVMAVRAEYDTMTAEEYFGALMYWTPDPYFQQKVGEKMKAGRLIRLHRSNPEGFYKTGRSMKRYKKEGDTFKNSSERDKVMQRRALLQMLKHPFKHLATTIPFAWRGIFVEYGYMAMIPFGIAIQSIVVVSLLYVAGLVFVFFYSFCKKRWDVFGVALLGMYLFGINAFFSHSLARYNQPLIPLYAVMLLVALSCLGSTKTKTRA